MTTDPAENIGLSHALSPKHEMSDVKAIMSENDGLPSPDNGCIGFLLLGGIHQSLHLVPAAAALASAGKNIILYVTSREEAIWCRQLLLKLGAIGIPVILLTPPRPMQLVGKLISRWANSKAFILLGNRKRFRSLLALVVAERTSTLLKRLPGPKPFMIHIPHGAGDRERGFEQRIKLFDHTIVAGNKDKRRMLNAGLVSEINCSISGYIKAAAVKKIGTTAPDFFNNGKPTVLYNPHFDKKLSSWWKFGREIISYFESQNRFNLIFAPHIRLWERLNQSDKSFLRKFRNNSDIIIDEYSRYAIDMTYVNYSDIYLGDVSSQVYEFIIHPRPCVFVLPQYINFRGDQNYAHCSFGDVCFESAALFAALEISKQRHAIYKDVQLMAIPEALGEMWPASIDRAAAIITRVIAPRRSTS